MNQLHIINQKGSELKMTKKIPSELIYQELNYRYGRMNRKSVPELADIETEKLVTELISRSGLESTWDTAVEFTHISQGQTLKIHLHDNGKEIVKELQDTGFLITFSGSPRTEA